MKRTQADRTVLSAVLLVVLGPAVAAQIATCLKNQIGPTACDWAIKPIGTVTCYSSGTCPTKVVQSDSQCYRVVAATTQDVGRNNTVTPTPQKTCEWQNRGCVVPEGGTTTMCALLGTFGSMDVYCPEIAGATCNGGIAPGGGGGND